MAAESTKAGAADFGRHLGCGRGGRPPTAGDRTIRIWLLLAFMIVAALSSWMLFVGQASLLVRLATNLSCGFNLIWIFSSFGPPVVVASVLAAGLATVPAPRHLLPY